MIERDGYGHSELLALVQGQLLRTTKHWAQCRSQTSYVLVGKGNKSKPAKRGRYPWIGIWTGMFIELEEYLSRNDGIEGVTHSVGPKLTERQGKHIFLAPLYIMKI